MEYRTQHVERRTAFFGSLERSTRSNYSSTGACLLVEGSVLMEKPEPNVTLALLI